MDREYYSRYLVDIGEYDIQTDDLTLTKYYDYRINALDYPDDKSSLENLIDWGSLALAVL